MTTIDITLDVASGTALLKCISQAMQRVELDLDRSPNPKRAQELQREWSALDDALDALQAAKREAMG